jgi:hypothetical protein
LIGILHNTEVRAEKSPSNWLELLTSVTTKILRLIGILHNTEVRAEKSPSNWLELLTSVTTKIFDIDWNLAQQ